MAEIPMTNNSEDYVARIDTIKIAILKVEQPEVIFLMPTNEKESETWINHAKLVDFYLITDHEYEHFWAD